MAGAISGFGGFRDIGDPYDRRRGESRPLDRTFDAAQVAELMSRLVERDPDIEAPASLYLSLIHI